MHYFRDTIGLKIVPCHSIIEKVINIPFIPIDYQQMRRASFFEIGNWYKKRNKTDYIWKTVPIQNVTQMLVLGASKTHAAHCCSHWQHHHTKCNQCGCNSEKKIRNAMRKSCGSVFFASYYLILP